MKKVKYTILLLILLLTITASPVFANGDDDYYGMMDWMMGGLNFGGYMFIFPFIIILFLLFFWVWFSRDGRGSFCGGYGKEDEALRILKARYAKGEIDKKEFEEKKRDLL